MPEQPTAPPPSSRITVELCTRYVKHYARLQGLSDWAFSIEVVPGLQHPGPDGTPADAWAVVEPDALTKTAHVQVRDIDATPVPVFDGDPFREIRVTISHELWHCAVAEYQANPSIEAEEKLVEAAAQAVVMSEGTGDARLMARSVAAIPNALRARISARAFARGGPMDGKQVLAAIAGQDEAAALKILNDWAAEQLAAAGHPGAAGVEPDGDEAAKLAATPLAGPAAAPPPAMDAAVGRSARLAADMERMHAAAMPAAKTALLTSARARLALTPATEKRIMDAPTFEEAQQILAIVEEAGAGISARARSGVQHSAAPDVSESSVKTEPTDKLLAEGFDHQFIARYESIAKSEGADAAAGTLTRGRVTLQRSKARRAREAKVVAS